MMMMAQTARAFTSGSNDFSDMIFGFEEAPVSMMEFNTGGAGRSSAENAEATMIKNILTSEENTVAFCSNEGERRSVVLTTEANNVMMFATNMDKNRLSGPMQSRVFPMAVQPSQRLDRGSSDTNRSVSHPNQEAAAEFSRMRFRRDQYLTALLCEVIRRRIMPPVNLTVVDDVLSQFVALAAENGAFSNLRDNRNVERIKSFTHSLVVKYAIHRVFDLELANLRRERDTGLGMDPNRNFELNDILLLGPFLVATPEIVWFAMELGMCQFRDMGEQTVIKAIKKALFSEKEKPNVRQVDMYLANNILDDSRAPGQMISSSGVVGEEAPNVIVIDESTSVEHVTHDKDIGGDESKTRTAPPVDDKKTKKKKGKNDVSDIRPIQGYFSPERRARGSDDDNSDSVSVVAMQTRQSVELQLQQQQQQPSSSSSSSSRQRPRLPFSNYRPGVDLRQQMPFSMLDRCRILASRIAPFVETRISEEYVSYILMHLTTRHVVVDTALEVTKSVPVLKITQKGDVSVIQAVLDRVDEDVETQVLLKVFQAPGCKRRLQIRARSVPGYPSILQTIQLEDVEVKDTSLDVLRVQARGHYNVLRDKMKSHDREVARGSGAGSSVAPLLEQLKGKRVVTNPYNYNPGTVEFFKSSIRSVAHAMPSAIPSNFDISNISAESRLTVSSMGDFTRVLTQHLRTSGWSAAMLNEYKMPPVDPEEYDKLVKSIYEEYGRTFPTYAELFKIDRTPLEVIEDDIRKMTIDEDIDREVSAFFQPPTVGMALRNALTFVPAAPIGFARAQIEAGENEERKRAAQRASVVAPLPRFVPLRRINSRPIEEEKEDEESEGAAEDEEEPGSATIDRLPIHQRAVSTSSSNRSHTPRILFSPIEGEAKDEDVSMTDMFDKFKSLNRVPSTDRTQIIQKFVRSAEPEISSNGDAASSVASMFDGLEDDEEGVESMFN